MERLARERGLRVLLTGGAGFIGSHVAEHFLERGHEVAVVDDLSNGRFLAPPVGSPEDVAKILTAKRAARREGSSVYRAGSGLPDGNATSYWFSVGWQLLRFG